MRQSAQNAHISVRPQWARRNYFWLWGATVLIFLSVGLKANAELVDSLQSWFAQPTLAGDWGGLRTELLYTGIKPYLVYIGEVAHNTNGLNGVATDYAHSVTLGADFDLGQIGIDQGGAFHFSLSERTGRNIGPEKLGSLFQTFEIVGGGRDVRLNEMSLEQVLANGRVNLKIGYFPTSGIDPKEFAWLPAFLDFISNAHHPVAMPFGAGWSYYPVGKWSARLRFSPSNSLAIQAGVVQVNPSYGLTQNGFKIDFQGDTGAIFPFEITYQPQYDQHYPGMYKLGVYYDTSIVPDQFTLAKRDHGRKGIYFEGQQKIYSEPSNPASGLTAVGYYAAADESTGLVSQNHHFGLSYQGLFPGRELDKTNIGWFDAEINPRVVAREKMTGAAVQSATEHLLEISYAALLSRWLEVRPGVQYVANPGNIESHPNAWVFVLRTQANF